MDDLKRPRMSGPDMPKFPTSHDDQLDWFTQLMVRQGSVAQFTIMHERTGRGVCIEMLTAAFAYRQLDVIKYIIPDITICQVDVLTCMCSELFPVKHSLIFAPPRVNPSTRLSILKYIHEEGFDIDSNTLECIVLSDDLECSQYALSACGPDIRSDIVDKGTIDKCIAIIGVRAYLDNLNLCDHVADGNLIYEYICGLGHKPSVAEYSTALEYEQLDAFTIICQYSDVNSLRSEVSDNEIAVMYPFLKVSHRYGLRMTESMYQVATDSDFWECAEYIYGECPTFTAIVGNNTDPDIYTAGYLIAKRNMGCSFNDAVCSLACINHDLPALQYAYASGAKIGDALRVAAMHDSFECMKYIVLHCM